MSQSVRDITSYRPDRGLAKIVDVGKQKHWTFIPSSLMDIIKMTTQYIYNCKILMTIGTLVDSDTSVTALHMTVVQIKSTQIKYGFI